ncbi:hypothetical protein ACFL5S_01880, partial [Fibrobacterota bacterium]
MSAYVYLHNDGPPMGDNFLIQQNKANKNGGGICVNCFDNDCHLTLIEDNGEIISNESDISNGGGGIFYGTGSFVEEGTWSIINNTNGDKVEYGIDRCDP